MTTPAQTRYSIVKPPSSARSNGVLPVSGIASHSHRNSTGSSNTGSSRPILPRLKVVIRRLPPGLTQSEFETALGDQWKVGGDRVDWATYKLGKLSKEYVSHGDIERAYLESDYAYSPAKPSRPARFHLHLTKQEHLELLSNKVRETTFVDAKGSTSDPCLLGPPSVEFAPYGRVPNPKPRKDARQGTIDLDPEFINFLESLTNPTPKPVPVESGSDGESKPRNAPIVTPLIQYLRDKKANKGKEPVQVVAKNSKYSKVDSKESKANQGLEKKTPLKKDIAPVAEKRSATAIKVEKAARDAAKIGNKQVTSPKAAVASPVTASPATASPTTPTTSSTTPAPATSKRRERGSASAVERILRRDLGIGEGPVAGRRRRDTPPSASASSQANPPSPAKQAPIQRNVQNNATFSPTPGDPPSLSKPIVKMPGSAPAPSSTIGSTPPTGPASSRPLQAQKPAAQPAAQRPAPVQQQPRTPKPAPPAPIPSPGATQAFLKHANPSQGITEPLLETAFKGFGAVAKVEIDKKKGFAYVDFVEPEGLQKAMLASPVKVAQGQVVVLERKLERAQQGRNQGRGGASGNVVSPSGRGGGGAAGPPIASRSVRSGSHMRGRGGGGPMKGQFTAPNSNTAVAATAVPAPSPQVIPKDTNATNEQPTS
ncbi:MAG: hypothetical protein MMC33_009852 [Icmadophila ericetorum]|nr:hypothetical protein [Icmadophila ericetorum]